MTSQVSATFPDYCLQKILCFYINATSHLQVIKSTNVPGFHFERIVFPGQRLLFEAFPFVQLSIFTIEMSEAVLMDIVSCEQLRVEEADLSLAK